MDSVSIRVPYRNLKQSPEVELIAIDGQDHPHHNQDRGMGSDQSRPSSPPRQPMPQAALVLSCTMAAGVQFGWALQLSLLTPYNQVLKWIRRIFRKQTPCSYFQIDISENVYPNRIKRQSCWHALAVEALGGVQLYRVAEYGHTCLKSCFFRIREGRH